MSSEHSFQDKENKHPNRFRVQEGSIESICKSYVLDGERLKVKSILYKEKKHQHPKQQEKVEPREEKEELEVNEFEFSKLEYLEELGVLN